MKKSQTTICHAYPFVQNSSSLITGLTKPDCLLKGCHSYMTYRGSNLGFSRLDLFSALCTQLPVGSCVIFFSRAWCINIVWIIFFEGDNNHVTKPRARHLGLKFLLMSSLEGQYGCVAPKTAPSYMYICWVFLAKLRAEYSESGCKKRQLLRNVCDLHLSPMVGCPLAKCNDHVDTLTRDTRTIFERSRPFYG